MESIQQYQEFLKNALLIDQSRLIDQILHPDNYADHMNDIHNNETFSIELTTGKLIGTLDLVTEIKADIENVLQAKKNKLSNIWSLSEMDKLKNEISKLEADLNSIDDAISLRRYIFNWLLVPYWLSKELKSFGQVVFDCLGCHYWGISSISGDDSYEVVLSSLFDELNEKHC